MTDNTSAGQLVTACLPSRDDAHLYLLAARAFYRTEPCCTWKLASSSWQALSFAEFGVGALRCGHLRSVHVLIWLRNALQYGIVLQVFQVLKRKIATARLPAFGIVNRTKSADQPLIYGTLWNLS